jgi:hypothetical protein
VILILAMFVMAQPPTVEEILERYETAIGDPVVARAHETRVIRSRYEDTNGGEADVYEYFLAPNRYLHVTLRGEGAMMRLGTDGKAVWEDSPRGSEVLPPEKAPLVAREAVFNRHLKLRELYPQMRLVGAAAVAGRPAWQIEATTPEGAKEQMFFDAATGLLVRRKYDYIFPGGSRMVRDLIYEEYTDFGGVRLPSLTRQFSPFAALFRVERVDHNADLFEFVFAPPACRGKK